ncbi:MAG: sensor histidine kinase [Hyphomonadaceae bacterium]
MALRFGGDLRALAGLGAVALAPVLAGFILQTRMRNGWAQIYFVLAWALSGAMLLAVTGGWASPAATLLAIPIAYAAALGGAGLVWTALAFAVLAYGLGGFFASADPALGLLPFFLAAAGVLGAAFALAGLRARPAGEAASLRIAEAAHELRTPITHIVGFADMIEQRVFGENDPRYAEYAGLIRQSGGQLLELINRRLDLSRIEAGRYTLDREHADVNEIVREVAALSQSTAAAKGVTLEIATGETPLRAYVDTGAVRQVLNNIVGNAVKFTPGGGRVSVSTRVRGGDALIEVSDTGPGIPTHERARLTRRFERGENGEHAEGAGLGLGLARALTELHGGRLRIGDAQGGGARVTVRLPVEGRAQRG